jgi:hypothetical protein
MKRMTSTFTVVRLTASAAAFATLVGWCLHDSGQPDGPGVLLAGSGHAAVTPTYTQPQEKAMELGSIATTTTTPVFAPATGKAVPPLGK